MPLYQAFCTSYRGEIIGLNLILINSSENDSFAAVYMNNKFHVVKSSEFAGDSDKPGRSPGKLINCLLKLRREFEFENADAISVTIGPGSFTGVRVGLALAKGIAGGLDKPLIPINDFDLQYERILNKDLSRKYCVLIPAKKPEFYYSVFLNSVQAMTGCTTIEEIVKILGKNSTIAGNFDNESVLKHHYFEYLNLKNSTIKEDAAMLKLSKRYFMEEKQMKPESIEPVYIKDFTAKTFRVKN